MTPQEIAARAGTLAGMIAVIAGLTQLFSVNRTISETQSDNPGAPAALAGYRAGQINYRPGYSALDPLTAIDAGAADAAAADLFDPQDDYWGLPRSPGHEEVALYCTACHSLRIVMQQRQSPEGWDYLLRWMRDKQGMAPLAAEDRKAVLDYLAREFGGEE